MDVVIVGAGGHGLDVKSVVDAAPGLDFRCWLDDGPNFQQPSDKVQDYMDEGCSYLLGVNSPQVRRKLDRWKDAAVAIHPTAVVGPGCELEPGVVIGPNVVLQADVKLGRHVHIGANSYLTRASVGDYTTIGPCVGVGGDVTIGGECLIGIGARIRNLLTIGHLAVVGAGSVVVGDVPDMATVKGVPAR